MGSGECLAVDGPSGAGKTRLLRALADLDPVKGRIFLDGAEQGEVPGPSWRAMVRFVSAEAAWWTETAREALPVDDLVRTRVSRMVMAMGLATADLDRQIVTLSTGQRQRLALARALADDPSVLLLDEPTTGLDGASGALVEELIRYRLLSGNIVVIASHDGALLQRLANVRITIGKRVQTTGSAP